MLMGAAELEEGSCAFRGDVHTHRGKCSVGAEPLLVTESGLVLSCRC